MRFWTAYAIFTLLGLILTPALTAAFFGNGPDSGAMFCYVIGAAVMTAVASVVHHFNRKQEREVLLAAILGVAGVLLGFPVGWLISRMAA